MKFDFYCTVIYSSAWKEPDALNVESTAFHKTSMNVKLALMMAVLWRMQWFRIFILWQCRYLHIWHRKPWPSLQTSEMWNKTSLGKWDCVWWIFLWNIYFLWVIFAITEDRKSFSYFSMKWCHSVLVWFFSPPSCSATWRCLQSGAHRYFPSSNWSGDVYQTR